MKPLSQPRTAKKRAVSMLEFTLLLPMMLFLVAFVVDIGRLMMVSNAMTDVTYRTARAGAVAGGGDVVVNGQTVTKEAFGTALAEIPGANQAFNIKGPNIETGSFCKSTGDDRYVKVSTDYSVTLLTPGLGGLLSLAGGGDGGVLPGTFNMNATSVSRCEVVR